MVLLQVTLAMSITNSEMLATTTTTDISHDVQRRYLHRIPPSSAVPLLRPAPGVTLTAAEFAKCVALAGSPPLMLAVLAILLNHFYPPKHPKN
ncbi:hypothetical protein OC845_003119 [Tilletia horrida]|nr:hypothetical protein OC845_003119 [Tilletia horrida]